MIKRKIIELVYLWFFIGFKILSYFILIDVIYLKKLFYYRQRKISNAKTCINVVPRKVVWWKILLRHIGHHKIYSRIYICFCSISLILEYYAWVVKQDFQITFYRYIRRIFSSNQIVQNISFRLWFWASDLLFDQFWLNLLIKWSEAQNKG